MNVVRQERRGTVMYREKHTRKSWSLLRALPVALLALFVSSITASVAMAQSGSVRLEHDDDNYTGSSYRGGFIENDRTLDVEIWTDNESGEYYEGDEIQVYFRANRDAYVAVYNIDTDGRVNLIYPFDQRDDPYIEGGRIYRIPGPDADYDLLVDGPAGIENIQIVASRRPFAIPNWYEGSGLVADRDRYEFMDYLNNMYFGCRSGCPRALDNISYVVKEWDNYYYRPVYSQPWPVWGSYGGLYVDYYWGSSIYVDGYYYGIAPLYLPRIGYGHHVVTVYDSYGYGWENSVNVHNSTAIYLDNSIIRTTAGTRSRYTSVRKTGYRNPGRSGYAGVKITSKYRPRATAGKSITRTRAATSRTVTNKNGTTSRTKITNTKGKSAGVRGFGYKKNDRSAVSTKTTTRTRTTVTNSRSKSSKSSTSGKRLKSYKNSPNNGTGARVSKTRSSSKSSSSRKSSVSSSRKTSTNNKSSVRSRSGSKSSSRSSAKSSSAKRSSGKSSRGSSTYNRKGSKSSSHGNSKAGRSKSSRKSSGSSSVRKTRSGKKSSGGRSSARSGRSSGRSGTSARATRSSGSRSGKSSGASRGGRSKGKSKKK